MNNCNARHSCSQLQFMWESETAKRSAASAPATPGLRRRLLGQGLEVHPPLEEGGLLVLAHDLPGGRGELARPVADREPVPLAAVGRPPHVPGRVNDHADVPEV